MIEFITLFLGGLVIGPRPVEIMASDTVAIVEVWLDGELEERLSAPPWELEIDFGPEILPHVLEAVALDSREGEIARARQWINMSPQLAQMSLIIEGADKGKEAVAKVSWESLAMTNEPQSIEVYFDGQRLAAEDPRSIQLPPFDPRQTHHLRVRLEFTEVLFSETEAVFGGVYGNEISTEISAVPIRFARGKKPKSAQAMRDWFTVGGVPQNVHAFEKGPAEIVVVRDMATEPRLAELASQAARLETDIHLKKHHRLSFVSPCPEVHPRDGFRQFIYPRTTYYSYQKATLLQLLAHVVPTNCSEARQQIADAVAIAGLSASGDGVRRAVLLLIDGEPQDLGGFKPAQVVAYLERLRVPLWIWNVAPPSGPETRWGQATNVRKLGRLGSAFNQLEKDLEHQLIVWLEGLHLPQSVELRPDLAGISLVD